MFKSIAKEIKEEILNKIRNEGKSVSEVVGQYAVSSKTIYGWLHKGINGTDSNILEINHLKRENKELKEIIGQLILTSEKGKKNHYGKTNFK